MKNIGLKFSLLFIPYYALFATGPAFFVVILEGYNIAPNQIAVYTSLIALTSAIVQPLTGFLCDKTGKAKQILLFCCSVSVLAFLWLCFISSPSQILICSIIIGATINAMYGFIEGWLSKLDCVKLGVNFGAVRSCGSLSYAVTAAVYGGIFDIFGKISLPVVMGICVLIMIPISMMCPNPEIVKQDEKTSVDFKSVLKELFKNKVFVLTFLCYTVATFPTGAAITYYTVHLRQIGASGSDVGIALLILAGSEAVSMAFFKKLENKFGTVKLLIFAFMMYGVKNLLIGLAGSVPLAIAAAVTQAGCFAIAIPGIQSFVDKIIQREYAATAQLVCNTGGNLISQIIGVLIGGLITTFTTAGNALIITSVFGFISSFVFAVMIKKVYKEN